MPNCAIFRFDFDGEALALREVVDPMAQSGLVAAPAGCTRDFSGFKSGPLK